MLLQLMVLVILFHLNISNARPNFKSAGFFPYNSIFSDNIKQAGVKKILGLADMNSDTFTDIIALSEDEYTVYALLYDPKNFNFYLPGLGMGGFKYGSFSFRASSGKIRHVTSMDWDYDGLVDYIVQLSDRRVFFIKNYGTHMAGFSEHDIEHVLLAENSTSEPVIADFYGDGRLGLLITKLDQDTTPIIIVPSLNSTNLTDIFEFPPDIGCGLSDSSSHSSSVVDFDGDCRPDLLLHCKNGSYLINLSDGKGLNYSRPAFSLHQTGQFPKTNGALGFADFNGDSSLDALYSSCASPRSCFINLSYNQQKKFCSTSKFFPFSRRSSCREMHNLCSGDPKFNFKLEQAQTTDIPLKELVRSLPENSRPLRIVDGSSSLQPVDLDLDSYPDILAHVEYSNGKGVLLIFNIECPAAIGGLKKGWNNLLGAYCDGSGRGWKIGNVGVASLYSRRDIEQVVLLDIDEKGSMDLIILSNNLSKGPTYNDGRFAWAAFYNNLFNDAFFFKVSITNGACFKNCKTYISDESSGKKQELPLAKKPVGTSYPGAVYKFTILDVKGSKRVATGTQCTNNGIPSVKYGFVGLGRTNNYLEEFVVGISRVIGPENDADDTSVERIPIFTQSGLIPNSQLLVHPPSSLKAFKRNNDWVMELFINPSAYFELVLITLMAACIILGFVVAALRWMEKREDEEERRKALHILNFDAL